MNLTEMYMVTIIWTPRKKFAGGMVQVSFISTGLGDAQEHAEDWQKAGAYTIISKIVEISPDLYEKYKNS